MGFSIGGAFHAVTHAVSHAVSSATDYVHDHWKTFVVVGVSLAVFVAANAILPGFGGLIVAGALSAAAGQTTSDLLNGQRPGWDVLKSAVIGGVVTAATFGAGRFLPVLSNPIAQRAETAAFGAVVGGGLQVADNAIHHRPLGDHVLETAAWSGGAAVAGDELVRATSPRTEDLTTSGNGGARAAQHEGNWSQVSLDDAVTRLGPRDQVTVTRSDSGQKIYFQNAQGETVVYDPQGNYFRVMNGSGEYVGADGQPVSVSKPAVLDENGDPVLNARGQPRLRNLSKSEYRDSVNAQTHFANTGSTDGALALAGSFQPNTLPPPSTTPGFVAVLGQANDKDR